MVVYSTTSLISVVLQQQCSVFSVTMFRLSFLSSETCVKFFGDTVVVKNMITGDYIMKKHFKGSNQVVERQDLVKILVKTDVGHCHIMGRRGEGKSRAVSEFTTSVQTDKRTFVLHPDDNRFGKWDFLLPLYNALGITKKRINRYQGTKENACKEIAKYLLPGDVLIFEDVGTGNAVTGPLYFNFD